MRIVLPVNDDDTEEKLPNIRQHCISCKSGVFNLMFADFFYRTKQCITRGPISLGLTQ